MTTMILAPLIGITACVTGIFTFEYVLNRLSARKRRQKAADDFAAAVRENPPRLSPRTMRDVSKRSEK